MLQFNAEIIVSLAQAICYFGLIFLSLIKGIWKKITIFYYFAGIFLLYMLQFLFQGLSYMIILENFTLAYRWKVASVIFTIFVAFLSIILIDFIQSQRIRVWLLLFMAILGSFEFCILVFTGGLVKYEFIENGVIIATSIGKIGPGLLLDMILSLINSLVLLLFFTKSYRQAPASLKKITKRIMLVLYTVLLLAMLCNVLARLLPNNQLTLILYSSMGLFLLIFSAFLLFSIIRTPQVLYILPFRVDRLMIINYSGLCLYQYNFSASLLDNILLSGFIHGLQQLGVEILQKGEMREILLEKGVLIFRKMSLFTICMVTSQSSKMLKQSFDDFARAFETRFQRELEDFNGDLSIFGEANRLVTQYFEYIPLRT